MKEIIRTCLTCKWAFAETHDENYKPLGKRICANSSELGPYGTEIVRLDEEHGCWQIGLQHYEELLESGWSVQSLDEATPVE